MESEREGGVEEQDQEKTVIITYLRKSKGALTLMSLKTNIHSFIYLTHPGKFSSAVGFVVDILNHKK